MSASNGKASYSDANCASLHGCAAYTNAPAGLSPFTLIASSVAAALIWSLAPVLVAAFAILPFFSTVLGGLAAIRLRHRLHPIMAFAAGVLVATALADLLPEAAELIGGQGGPVMLGGAAVVGFLLFSALEALVHRQSWEHRH